MIYATARTLQRSLNQDTRSPTSAGSGQDRAGDMEDMSTSTVSVPTGATQSLSALRQLQRQSQLLGRPSEMPSGHQLRNLPADNLNDHVGDHMGDHMNDQNGNLNDEQPGKLPERSALVPDQRNESAPLSTTEYWGEYGKAAMEKRLTTDDSDSSDTSDAQLDSIRDQFQQRFTRLSQDPAAFQSLMKQSFGDAFDAAQAEAIRLQAQANDFSWMPDIQLVNGATLADQSGLQGNGAGLGAYSRDSDTIYLSRDLLHADPAKAELILSEEIGHALDARLNIGDAAGDEGEIFARLSHNEKISEEELKALRSENDTGVIVVDGKEVDVEYGWNPIKDLAKSVKKRVKRIGRSIKNGFNKLMNSKLVGTLLSVARFVPIPIVQGIAQVINIAKAGYSVYQGIKHRSLGAVLGGIAGAAGGVAKFGEYLGSSGSWVGTAADIADKAGQAGAAYRVLSEKDIGAALNYLRGKVSHDEPITDLLNGLSKANAVYQAQKSGDFVGTISAGSLLLQDFTDTHGDALLRQFSSNAETFNQFKEIYESNNLADALSFLHTDVIAREGKDSKAAQQLGSLREAVENIQSVNELLAESEYTSAAVKLMETAGMVANGSEANVALADAAITITLIGDAFEAMKAGRYDEAASKAGSALRRTLDDRTRKQVIQLFDEAQRLRQSISTQFSTRFNRAVSSTVTPYD